MFGTGKKLAARWRGPAVLACVLVSASLSLGVETAAAAAATRYVAAAGGSNTGNACLESADPCATIQHAIVEAAPGDTIQVAPGTYTENLTIPKSLTLVGPNVAVDPSQASRGPEATIDGGGAGAAAITPQAEGIVVDGFTVSTSSAAAPIRTVGADIDRLTIADNIIEGGEGAITFQAGGEQIAIERNSIAGIGYDIYLGAAGYPDLKIAENVIAGPVTYYGIFNSGGGTIEGFQLSGNMIEAASDIGANISAAAVTGNVVDTESPGGAGLQIDLHESSVSGNFFEGNGTTGCLQLFGSQYGLVPSSEVSVTENSFEGCNAYAIQLSPDIEAIEIAGNAIHGSYDGVNTRLLPSEAPWDLTGREIRVVANSITGSTHMGVNNTVSGTLDARDNWWGCNAGPGAPGCDAAGPNTETAPNVMLTGAVSAAALFPGEGATVTAMLNTDSAGAAVSGVPGGAVTFTSQLGAFASTAVPLAGGTASSTFAAGGQPGPAGIEVSLDAQQVPVDLTILSPPPAEVIPPPSVPPVVVPTAEPPKLKHPEKAVAVQGASATVGTLSCGPSSCDVRSKSATVKVGGKRFKASLKLPATIAAGTSTPITVVLSKSARKALAKRGVGTITVKIVVIDAAGNAVPRSITVRIK
jgi:nitrous oxidase accessory protein NosD